MRSATTTFAIAVALLAVFHAEAQNDEVTRANQQFAGISFGVGLSVIKDTGGQDRVSSATIDVNGFVRVNKIDNVRPRVMLESHYFFPLRFNDDKYATMGAGPFVALQPGTEDIIEAIGFGVMLGFRRTAANPGSSFNVGIGYVTEPSVRVLGNEFRANEAAPIGPDGGFIPIRFQERDQDGILMLASFTW